MNKTKQQIEEVIKKNLPEKVDDDGFAQDPSVAFNNGFDEALSQINPSKIADEVLKVVVEKIEKYIQEEIGKGTWNADSIGKELLEIIDYK